MKILIVKTSSLGDILQTFPVVRFLARHFPSAQIDWVVKDPYVELLKAHPLIHHVFTPRTLPKTHYDTVFDLQGNIKSGFITRRIKAKEKIGFSLRVIPEWPNVLFTSKRYRVDLKAPISDQYLSLVAKHYEIKDYIIDPQIRLNISPTEEKWVDEQIQGSAHRRYMVCVGSAWKNKKLSLTAWLEFLALLEKYEAPSFFFVWGNEAEKEEAEFLAERFSARLLPKMSLPVWQQMIQKMSLVLTADSSALHLAATTCTSTFSFFGPSSAEVYKPIGESHIAYQGTCPYNVSFTKRCPKLRTCATGACLKNIKGEVLDNEFKRVFRPR